MVALAEMRWRCPVTLLPSLGFNGTFALVTSSMCGLGCAAREVSHTHDIQIRDGS